MWGEANIKLSILDDQINSDAHTMPYTQWAPSDYLRSGGANTWNTEGSTE